MIPLGGGARSPEGEPDALNLASTRRGCQEVSRHCRHGVVLWGLGTVATFGTMTRGAETHAWPHDRPYQTTPAATRALPPGAMFTSGIKRSSTVRRGLGAEVPGPRVRP